VENQGSNQSINQIRMLETTEQGYRFGCLTFKVQNENLKNEGNPQPVRKEHIPGT